MEKSVIRIRRLKTIGVQNKIFIFLNELFNIINDKVHCFVRTHFVA